MTKREDHTTLATFRMDEGRWKDFVGKARSNGTTAKDLLIAFVDSYLDGREEILAKPSSRRAKSQAKADDPIAPIQQEMRETREAIAALKAEMAEIKGKLAA